MHTLNICKTVLASILAILLLNGCASSESGSIGHATLSMGTPFTASAMDRGESLYHRDWTWQNDAGKTMRLSDLNGRPQIVAMFFTSCAGTCGITVNHLQQLDASLTAEQRRRVGFLLVSFDSALDTPHMLTQYRATKGLPADWTLLRGSPQATQELAAALAVKFAPDSARHILHGAQITVLDAQGRVARRVPGVNADMHDVLAAVEQELDVSPPQSRAAEVSASTR